MAAIRALLALIATIVSIPLAAPVILFALPFWTVSLLTRAMSRWLEPRFVPWYAVTEYLPRVGWKPKANLRVHVLTHVEDDIFEVRTDSQGWPGPATLEESALVVFGDSYAFGYGVDATASFAARRNGPRIKAIAAPGYNMVQELLLMEHLAPHLRDKLVVWFIFVGNDLHDNLVPNHFHYRMPFVRRHADGWEIVTSHVSAQKWPYTSARYRDWSLGNRMLAEVHSRTFLAERAYSACEFLIARGSATCTRAGAHLTVMTIPDPAVLRPSMVEYLRSFCADPRSLDPEWPDKNIREICGRLGVPFVAGMEHLTERHYKELDPHWNEEGHEQVARLLGKLYEHYERSGHVPAA